MQNDVVKTQALVGNSFSLTDYIERMNKVMHADNEEFNSIPDQKDLIAQYLLLYEMSGDPKIFWKVVDYNYNKLNVNFQLKSDNSKAINSAISEIEKYKDDFKNLELNELRRFRLQRFSIYGFNSRRTNNEFNNVTIHCNYFNRNNV